MLQGVALAVVSEWCQELALGPGTFYEGAALSVRFERVAIFSAHRSFDVVFGVSGKPGMG